MCKKGIKNIVSCMVVLLSVFSCSPEVDLCLNHDHRGKVNFSFDWTNVAYSYPSQVNVLALRPIRREKFQWSLPSDGITSKYLDGGAYEFTAFTGDADLSGLQSEAFLNEYTTSVADIQVSYELTSTLKDSRFAGRFLKMKDRNPYSCYIVGADSCALYKANTTHELPLTVTLPDSTLGGADDTINVTFEMHPVSQRVTLKFAMRTKDIDGIDSVKCILSGVGKSVYISTCHVNIDTTYKAPFAPVGTLAQDADGLYRVSHTIDVPGIVRNPSPNSVSGPGILQVDVYVHFRNEEGLHNVVLTGIMNLYQILAKTPSLVYDADGIPTQSAPEITLNIDNVMLVSKDRIEGSIEGSLGNWIDDTEITIDY